LKVVIEVFKSAELDLTACLNVLSGARFKIAVFDGEKEYESK
jgi:hypothetical protein